MAEGEFAKVDGDSLYASEVNNLNSYQQVYAGVGFDSTRTGANGSTTEDHELTEVTNVTSTKKYAVIKIHGICVAGHSGNAWGTGTVQVKIQIKEIGGAYADIMAYKTVAHIRNYYTTTINNSISIEYAHTLTAGQKTNGFQVKVFSQSITADGNNGIASFTNIQTTLSLLGA